MLVVQSGSSREEGPLIPLLHTLKVYQSVCEVAAQCYESVPQGVGLLHQQRRQLVHHPALSHPAEITGLGEGWVTGQTC